MLVFLRTFNWGLSRGIRSRSLPDAFVSIFYRVSFLPLGCRGGACRTIPRSCEGGHVGAGERDVRGRCVRAAARRSGFRARRVRKSLAAAAAEPGGAQFAGLGAVRAERSRRRDCTL